MNFRRAFLSRLRPDDRLAVTLLRGGDSPKVAQEIRDAFSALRERATQAGLVILAPEAPTVGSSEFAVLGLLALWQRSRVEPGIEQWRIPVKEVQTCAQMLDAVGRRIDYGHIVHVQGVDSVNFARSACSGEQGLAAEFPDPDAAGRSPLRHRILSELTRRGQMKMAELEQLGVSRQTVSNMVRRGFIRRLRHGVYSVPERLDAIDVNTPNGSDLEGFRP